MSPKLLAFAKTSKLRSSRLGGLGVTAIMMCPVGYRVLHLLELFWITCKPLSAVWDTQPCRVNGFVPFRGFHSQCLPSRRVGARAPPIKAGIPDTRSYIDRQSVQGPHLSTIRKG
jgi:hypothetical protein